MVDPLGEDIWLTLIYVICYGSMLAQQSYANMVTILFYMLTRFFFVLFFFSPSHLLSIHYLSLHFYVDFDFV